MIEKITVFNNELNLKRINLFLGNDKWSNNRVLNELGNITHHHPLACVSKKETSEKILCYYNLNEPDSPHELKMLAYEISTSNSEESEINVFTGKQFILGTYSETVIQTFWENTEKDDLMIFVISQKDDKIIIKLADMKMIEEEYSLGIDILLNLHRLTKED